jgi:hypothetical protein
MLTGAREVVVNLTGGTTAMQAAVERIAGESRRLGIPVRRIALVDRRPFDLQRSDLYVAAEVLELDDG